MSSLDQKEREIWSAVICLLPQAARIEELDSQTTLVIPLKAEKA